MQNLWTEISANPVGFALLGCVALICGLFSVQLMINCVRSRGRKRPLLKTDAIADSLCHSMASGKEWKTQHRNWAFLQKKNSTPAFNWIEVTRNTNQFFPPVVVKYKRSVMDDPSKVEIRGAARKRLIKAMAALHESLVTKRDRDAVDTVLTAVTDTSSDKCLCCGLTKNKED